MTNDDDKMLWQRIKGPASSPSRLGPHPERLASSPSRLASLAPQDEDAGSRRTLAPQDGDAGSGGAVTPHPEAAAQRPSKDVDLLQLSAWIDGRLDREEADAVEARLADDPQSLELALAAEQALGLAAPWPKRAQARAAAIVAPARLSLRVLVAAIAAMLLLALGGFEMGSIGSETTAAANGAETDLAVEFGLLPGADIVEVSL
jgi:hypothetical protein